MNVPFHSCNAKKKLNAFRRGLFLDNGFTWHFAAFLQLQYAENSSFHISR